MERIVIIGTTGTGKSTLAKQLSTITHIPVVEMDDLYWRQNWTIAPAEEFSAAIDNASKGGEWIMVGNYGKQSGYIHWKRADTLIWLDYSFWRAFRQLLTRCVKRIHDKQQICNGNTESLANFFSRDSIMLWLFRSYWKRRREIPQLVARPEYAHLKVLRFHTPREAEAFLSTRRPH